MDKRMGYEWPGKYVLAISRKGQRVRRLFDHTFGAVVLIFFRDGKLIFLNFIPGFKRDM